MRRGNLPVLNMVFSTCATVLAFVVVAAFAPEVLAQVSRVTSELDNAAGEVEKWAVSAQTIFSALVGILACVVGYQWWEERGRGKDSAKGLMMGVFFALAIAPWFVSAARGCAGGG